MALGKSEAVLQIFDMHIQADASGMAGGAVAANGTVRAGLLGAGPAGARSVEAAGTPSLFATHLDVATVAASGAPAPAANAVQGVSLEEVVAGKALLDGIVLSSSPLLAVPDIATGEMGGNVLTLASMGGAALDLASDAMGATDLTVITADQFGEGAVTVVSARSPAIAPVMFPITFEADQLDDSEELATQAVDPMSGGDVSEDQTPVFSPIVPPVVVGTPEPGFFPDRSVTPIAAFLSGGAPSGQAGGDAALPSIGAPVLGQSIATAPQTPAAAGPGVATSGITGLGGLGSDVGASGGAAANAPVPVMPQPAINASVNVAGAKNPENSLPQVQLDAVPAPAIAATTQPAASQFASAVAPTVGTEAALAQVGIPAQTKQSGPPSLGLDLVDVEEVVVAGKAIDAGKAGAVDLESVIEPAKRPLDSAPSVRVATAAVPGAVAALVRGGLAATGLNVAGQVGVADQPMLGDGLVVADDAVADADTDGLPRPPQGNGPDAPAPKRPVISATLGAQTPATPVAMAVGFDGLGADGADGGDAYEIALGAAGRGGEARALPTLNGTSAAQTLPMALMAMEITRNAQRGVSRFEIRLDPPELGRVDVRLKIGDDGQVRAHLIVERPETLDMLLRDQRGMERALENAGLKTPQGGGLEFSLKDQGGQAFADGGNAAGDGLGDRNDGGDGEQAIDQQTALERVAAYTRSGAGGLDIRV